MLGVIGLAVFDLWQFVRRENRLEQQRLRAAKDCDRVLTQVLKWSGYRHQLDVLGALEELRGDSLGTVRDLPYTRSWGVYVSWATLPRIVVLTSIARHTRQRGTRYAKLKMMSKMKGPAEGYLQSDQEWLHSIA
jgi:hypothetical protein